MIIYAHISSIYLCLWYYLYERNHTNEFHSPLPAPKVSTLESSKEIWQFAGFFLSFLFFFYWIRFLCMPLNDIALQERLITMYVIFSNKGLVETFAIITVVGFTGTQQPQPPAPTHYPYSSSHSADKKENNMNWREMKSISSWLRAPFMESDTTVPLA